MELQILRLPKNGYTSFYLQWYMKKTQFVGNEEREGEWKREQKSLYRADCTTANDCRGKRQTSRLTSASEQICLSSSSCLHSWFSWPSLKVSLTYQSLLNQCPSICNCMCEVFVCILHLAGASAVCIDLSDPFITSGIGPGDHGETLRCRCIIKEKRPIGRYIGEVKVNPASSHCRDVEIM